MAQLRPLVARNGNRRSPLNDRMYPDELTGPPLVPPPPPANYHPAARFTKSPYVQQSMPVPPVPRHAGTPPRANGRLHAPVPQYPLLQQQQPQQQPQQSLSPIRSASETESGSPLGGLGARPALSSLVRLQKSPSAPPLRQPRPPGAVTRFEFPGPPRVGASVRGGRHRSDESLSGVGSSMRGEAYSTRVHSSADDVSSANRSERSASETEDSSSDESYTKTEAEVDPDSPGASPGHFRLAAGGALPASLDIEKAWSRMNAEFAPGRVEPPKGAKASREPRASAADHAEAIELKG